MLCLTNQGIIRRYSFANNQVSTGKRIANDQKVSEDNQKLKPSDNIHSKTFFNISMSAFIISLKTSVRELKIH